MKKFLRALFVLMFVAVPVLLTACGPATQIQATITSYEISDAVTSYETDDSFSIEGYHLVLHYSDASTKTILLSNSMLTETPNMATAGVKTITFSYEGQTYSFNISVLTNAQTLAKQAYIQQLNDFLETYQTSPGSSLSVDFSAMLEAMVFGESNLEEYANSWELSASDLASSPIGYTVYQNFIKALVTSSLDVDMDEIIDVETLQSKLDLQKLLNALEVAASYDYYDAMIHSIFIEADSYYVQPIAGYICSEFCIDDQIGQYQVYALIENDIFLKIMDREEIDFASILTDFNAILQTYSQIPQEALDLIDEMVPVALETPEHCLSELIKKLDFAVFFYDYTTGEFVATEAESEDLQLARTNYLNSVSSLALGLENLYTDGLVNTISGWRTAVDEIDAIYADLDANSYRLDGMAIPTADLAMILEYAYNGMTMTLTELDGEYNWINMLASEMATIACDMANTSDQHETVGQLATVIENYIHALVYELPVDHISFIADCSAILGFDMSQFVADYEEFGTPYLMTYFAEQYLSEINFDFENSYGATAYDDFSAALLDLSTAIDEISVSGCDTLLTDLHTFLETTYAITYNDLDVAEYVLNSLIILTNPEASLSNNVVALFTEYDVELKQALAEMIYTFYSIEEVEPSSAYSDIYAFVSRTYDAALSGELVMEDVLVDFLDITETYAVEEVKLFTYSWGAMILITSGADVDYNEIFAGVPLPEGIESIDYNLLVSKLTSSETYDMLDIEDVVVEVMQDQAGNIIGETLTLTVNLNFDLMVLSLTGNATISFQIMY